MPDTSSTSASTSASGSAPGGSSDTGDAVLRYEFAFARPELVAGRLFGITPESAGVTIEGDRFVARFGPWTVDTSLANVAGAELTGPYRWPLIIGPARVSLRDRGLTFATNDRQGVCISFREPVRGIDALGVVRHPALTVTVDDAPSLVGALQQAARLAADAADRAERHPGDPTVVDDDGEVPAPTVDEVIGDVLDDLHGMTARELRERARNLGIAGVGSMKKEELIESLTH